MRYFIHIAKDESSSDTLIVEKAKYDSYIFNKSWLKTEHKPTHTTLDYGDRLVKELEFKEVSRTEALKFLITVGACMP